MNSDKEQVSTDTAEEIEEWNYPINKTLFSILWTASMFLIPIAMYLVSAHLKTENMSLKTYGAAVSVAWFGLSLVFLGPIFLIGALPAIAGFIFGPPQFRQRWIILQLCSWICTFLFASIGINIWMQERSKEFAEALSFQAYSTVPAAIAFYLLAMSLMPTAFFDEDLMGQRVKKFIGVKSTAYVSLSCFGASVAFLLIAALIWWVPFNTFKNSN